MGLAGLRRALLMPCLDGFGDVSGFWRFGTDHQWSCFWAVLRPTGRVIETVVVLIADGRRGIDQVDAGMER